MRDELLRRSLMPGRDVELAVVTFTSKDKALAHREHFDLAVPFLLDPERRSYESYGFNRASNRRVWGLRNGLRYLQLLSSGKRLLGRSNVKDRTREDTNQLGGDIVVNGRRLTWGYWSAGPDDRPAAVDVVNAVLDAQA